MKVIAMDVDSTVKLISTDRKEFTVHTYHLLSASSVFRDMLSSDPTSHEIEFADPCIEDGSTLQIFHDQLYNITVPDANTVRLEELDRLLGFLSKYDCQSLINTVRLGLTSYLPLRIRDPLPRHVSTPLRVFVLAASYSCTSTCAEALGAFFEGDSLDCYWDALHPRRISARTFERIPPLYAWGLIQAVDWPKDTKPTADMWHKASKTFRLLVSEAQKAGQKEPGSAGGKEKNTEQRKKRKA